MSDPTSFKPPGADAFWDGYKNAGKSLQTFASEIQRASKENLDATTRLMEQLRSAKTMEEVVSIQTAFMQQSFSSYAETTRRLSELMMSVPMELARQGQSTFNKAADEASAQMQKAGEQMTSSHG